MPGGTDLHTYDVWLALYPALASSGQSGENDDFDKDGYKNILEYALGTDPTDSSSIPSLPVTVTHVDPGTGSAPYLLYSYTRPIAAPGLSISPESSQTLSNDWEGGVAAVEAVFHRRVRNAGATETITYRSKQPVSSVNGLWLRFKVERGSQ